MSAALHANALWIVVAWPLLLIIPALRSRLPWPRLLALIPAVVLIVLPGDASLELPWLLFGPGFAIDGKTRWILAMSVMIWLTSALIAKNSGDDPIGGHATPFFLLTLTGNLGAVLATDLIGFLSFSTLMGYSFYGLLIQGDNAKVRRAGRLYLFFLIVADLALFEALLLAAVTTDNLRFDAVHQAIPGSASAQLYVWMVFVGYALKAGAWPFHLWLRVAFSSAQMSRALLLGAVPVAIGLLGAVRWLPIGEHAFYVSGTILQLMGAAALLYVLLRMLTSFSVQLLPAWVCIGATGLFIMALGTGLAYPTVWHQYEYFTYPLIASLGLILAALVFSAARMQNTSQQADATLQRVDALSLQIERYIGLVQQWITGNFSWLLTLWRVTWLKALNLFQSIIDWHKLQKFLSGWSTRITLFVLLGLALTWLAG